MTENIESLVLEHLRAIGAKQGEHDERLSRMESRLSNLEMTVAGMRRDLAHRYGEVVAQHADYGRLTARVERIERRLDLIDSPNV